MDVRLAAGRVRSGLDGDARTPTSVVTVLRDGAVARVTAPTPGRVVRLVTEMIGEFDLDAGLQHLADPSPSTAEAGSSRLSRSFGWRSAALIKLVAIERITIDMAEFGFDASKGAAPELIGRVVA